MWSGNVLVIVDGELIIFDLVIYWGDCEVDIVMIELFGGFFIIFYCGYNEVWFLDDGYK